MQQKHLKFQNNEIRDFERMHRSNKTNTTKILHDDSDFEISKAKFSKKFDVE